MKFLRFAPFFMVSTASYLTLSGCSNADSPESTVSFSSPKAGLAVMEFSGVAITSCTRPDTDIQNQIMYSVGHLNGDNSVGRIDSLKITDIKVGEATNGNCRTTYKASMPVGYAKYPAYVPSSYVMRLPLDATRPGLKTFFSKYGETCRDWADHVTSDNLWYYYRPTMTRCKLLSSDVATLTATLTTSSEDRSGTYPEYDKIWEDRELNAIIVFGMYGTDGNPENDTNANIYSMINERLRTIGIGAAKMTADIPNLPSMAGYKYPKITWTGKTPDGRKITIHTSLVSNPKATGSDFDTFFKENSPKADFISYNGHADFGANIRAFAAKAQFVPNHYTMFSIMGCDTFAYIDNALSSKVAKVNSDDPKGTKYLDMMTNLTPTKPAWLVAANFNMLEAFINISNPLSYDQILRTFDPGQAAVVTGDEDNAFVLGTPILK